jgi:RNA polymerase sigma-70 factor (ECF subfamily)
MGSQAEAPRASEQALVGRSPEEAVPELVDRLGDRVFAFSLKFCGNREDAEDLVQETFLQAYRKWYQFEGRSSPASWLYTMAARACQRRNRRRAGEPPRVDSLDEEPPTGLTLAARLPALEDGPLDDELRREAAEIVDRGLARLPADYRLPLVLKEIAELSLREIAEILDVKEATVKTRVHRGRLALRAALTEKLGKPLETTGDHAHQVCLDLLHAKLDAMDRGVEFPVPDPELCGRCQAFLHSLDVTGAVCRWVQGGELSASLRQKLEARFAAELPPSAP